jgi:signal transduction histidine kinase
MEGERALLTVANTGPVVPPDAVDRLFQPFQRLGTARTGEGLGLGLSIVQAIATAHDATIAATVRPAGGLSVTVTFPSPAAPAITLSSSMGEGAYAADVWADGSTGR